MKKLCSKLENTQLKCTTEYKKFFYTNEISPPENFVIHRIN